MDEYTPTIQLNSSEALLQLDIAVEASRRKLVAVYVHDRTSFWTTPACNAMIWVISSHPASLTVRSGTTLTREKIDPEHSRYVYNIPKLTD